MTWFKVDDKFPTSPKVMRIPRAVRLAAIGLWTTAGAWSAAHEQDGGVPTYMVDEWCPDGTLAGQLVTVGLWIETEGGYVFHDWNAYQPTRAENDARREGERKRKEEWRRRKTGKSTESHGGVPAGHEGDHQGTDGFVPSIPTRPDPTRPGQVEEPLSPGEPDDDKGSLISDDWRPNQQHIDKADSLHLDVRDEYRRFRDHAERSHRRLKNWNTGFTNWLRKTAEYRQQQLGRPAQPNKAMQRQADNVALVERMAALDAARTKGLAS